MTFTYHGIELPYADFEYNTTRLNERAVELPVAWSWVDNSGLRTLEVGNVLAHYPWPPVRDVVDRWEVADGVDNKDVFDIEGEWDQIVSISTLEHVRWDEGAGREPGGSQAAVEHLRGLLSPGGRMLVTIPTGHNAPLDMWLAFGETGAERCCTLVRDGDGWVQTDEVQIMPYGLPPGWAGSVWIGEWIAPRRALDTLS